MKLILMIFITLFAYFVNVNSQEEFNINLEIQENYQKINPGDEIIADMTLYGLGVEKRIDVNIITVVLDEEGNYITGKEETLAIGEQLDHILELRTPSYIKPGNYILEVKVKYDNKIIVNKDRFRVAEESTLTKSIMLERDVAFTSITVLLVIFVLILIFYNRKLDKLIKEEDKVDIEEIVE